jgi:hypothetical protein
MDNSEWQIRSLVLRFIESLLKLYPSRFRHEFYPEIQEVILSCLHSAEQSGQWPSAVVHEIAGLVPSIIQERWHDLRFRKETFMIIANEKPGWFFYFKWVALNVMAVIMAWYIASAGMSLDTEIVESRIQGDGDSLFLYLLFPIIGLLTGIFQYILLRRYLPHMGWWIAATFLGWLMPFVIDFIFSGVFIPGSSTVRIVLGMIVLGTTVALPQWWLLRKRVQHAWWWVLVSGLAWGMFGLYDLWSPSDMFPVLLGFAVVPAIATSIACWLLLDRLPNHELSSRTSSQ